ncbi:ankyrin repeat domain-containing protein [Marmoricola sp. OAE513]|uniref:ankyrin repeat domain-containing protein n=1 Tax=Marmoricola sp. OAE513 TaxID=2817894 RepID=UPI001AE77290
MPTATPTATSTPTLTAAQARRLGLRAVAALKRDDPAAALALVERGADVNVQDDLQDSVFLYAGAEGYVDVVRAALRNGADVRSTNRYGGTALIPASEHAHLDVIRVLLATDIEVDHVNDLGWTALGEAVGLGNGGPDSQEAVRLLLAAGADPAVRDRFGRTVLQNAERRGFDQIARQIRAALAR